MVTALPAAAASPQAEVRKWRQANERQILQDFSTMLAMPNVATTLPDVETNATAISALLAKRGFRTQLLRAAPGTPPSIYAERLTPGAKRTVVFYAHYDGQPINQKGWLSPPFTPTLRTAPPASAPVGDLASIKGPIDPDWRIYARSAGDDKAPIQAMISALDALKASGIAPTVNIKLLYEGEEEQGSPNFPKIVAQNLALLRGDLLIFGDGPMHQSGRQQINGGNRGITSFAATVYGPNKPLHDGHYGSWAPSPAVMIADFVMSLRDDAGHIKISGFYDDVAPVTAAEKAALAAMPPVEPELKTALGLGRTIGPPRLADGYLSPTLNVRAIHAGDDGPNAANAIATEASASVDFRLTPGQTPARVKALTEAYLTRQGWFIVRDTPDAATRLAHPKVLRLNWDDGGAVATMTRLDTPAAVAVAGSIGRTTGEDVIKLPIMGGSSAFAEIVDQLKVPMVGVSIANYDDNQHARNENLRIGNLWDGIEVYAGLLADLTW
ncbi:M20/M25/M40 family metallo-hydrolase [Polymorphobacter fuscus]|nr:M20/M25/M40 family metallo-hydrolase [Polymorphobacter fuscus]NJC09995.1 acetylornithine deacetylase/succinyl-diaminopimelate desuccinylase-like protein [Polymorphobacter fuscus]